MGSAWRQMMNLKIIKMIKMIKSPTRFKMSQDQGRLWQTVEEKTGNRHNMVATLEGG